MFAVQFWRRGLSVIAIISAAGVGLALASHHFSSKPQILPGLHGNKVAYSPDNRLLAVGDSQGVVTLWSTRSQHITRTINTGIVSIRAMAFSPDGSTLTTSSLGLGYASGPPGQVYDYTIHVWDTASGKLRQILTGHSGVISSLTFTKDGQTLISGSDDGTVKLWKFRRPSWHLISSLVYGRGASVYAVSAGEETLAVGGTKGVQLWDLRNSHLLKQPSGYWGSIYAVSLSSDGKYVAASGQDPALRLWNTTDWSMMEAIVPKAGSVFFLAFSPNGKMLISSSNAGCHLWNVHPLIVQRQLSLSGVQEQGPLMAFSPDGKAIVGPALVPRNGADAIQKWAVP